MQGSADSVRLPRASRSISDTTKDHQRSTRDTLRGCGDSKWTSHHQRRQNHVQLKPLVCSTNTVGQTHLARHTPRSRLLPARFRSRLSWMRAHHWGPVLVPATFGHSCRCQLLPRTLTYVASRCFDNDAGSRRPGRPHQKLKASMPWCQFETNWSAACHHIMLWIFRRW